MGEQRPGPMDDSAMDATGFPKSSMESMEDVLGRRLLLGPEFDDDSFPVDDRLGH